MASSRPPPTEGSKQPLIMGVLWAEALVGTTLMALRIYSKLTVTPEMAKNNVLWALWAWFITIVDTIFATVAVSQGLGKHASLFAYQQIVWAMEWAYIAQALALLASAFARVATAAFVIQIQGQIHRKARIFLIALMIFNVLLSILQMTLLLLGCNPTKHSLGPDHPGACTGINYTLEWWVDIGYAIGACFIVTDIILALYPAFIIKNLYMPKRVKIGISFLLSLGLFAAACATVRTYEVHTAAESKDLTWSQSDLTIWAVTEPWVIIIVSSIAPLYRLFKRGIDNLTSISATKYTKRRGTQESYEMFDTDKPKLRDVRSNPNQSKANGQSATPSQSEADSHDMFMFPENRIKVEKNISVEHEFLGSNGQRVNRPDVP